jgi:hypothetical protein
MIEVIKTLRKVREVLRVNNRQLLLLSLLHRPILPPCCLFATGTLEGWVGTKSLPASLQRFAELLRAGQRLRFATRARAPRFFLRERDVRRRDQPMKTVVLVFSLAPLFGANVPPAASSTPQAVRSRQKRSYTKTPSPKRATSSCHSASPSSWPSSPPYEPSGIQ